MPRGRKERDWTGQVFGALTALKSEGLDVGRHAMWRYRCTCGVETVRRHDGVATTTRQGQTASCGCVRLASLVTRVRKHGGSNTEIYQVWDNMIRRCRDVDNPNYGGRGVSVCPQWHDFAQFQADVGHLWMAGKQIDRVDNNGNYEPSNVRWATPKENARNKSNNIKVANVPALSESSGLTQHAIAKRIRRGWDVADLTMPLLPHGHRRTTNPAQQGTSPTNQGSHHV